MQSPWAPWESRRCPLSGFSLLLQVFVGRGEATPSHVTGQQTTERRLVASSSPGRRAGPHCTPQLRPLFEPCHSHIPREVLLGVQAAAPHGTEALPSWFPPAASWRRRLCAFRGLKAVSAFTPSSLLGVEKLFPWHFGFISKGWGDLVGNQGRGSYLKQRSRVTSLLHGNGTNGPSRGCLGFGVPVLPQCSSRVTVKVIEHL